MVLWDEDAGHKAAKFVALAVYHGHAQAKNGKQLPQRLIGRKTPGQQGVPSPPPPSWTAGKNHTTIKIFVCTNKQVASDMMSLLLFQLSLCRCLEFQKFRKLFFTSQTEVKSEMMSLKIPHDVMQCCETALKKKKAVGGAAKI